MAMKNCPECFSTPCTCGYEYRNWSRVARLEVAAVVLGVNVKDLQVKLGSLVPEVHPAKEEEDEDR